MSSAKGRLFSLGLNELSSIGQLYQFSPKKLYLIYTLNTALVWLNMQVYTQTRILFIT